jgi:hypothetical protein
LRVDGETQAVWGGGLGGRRLPVHLTRRGARGVIEWSRFERVAALPEQAASLSEWYTEGHRVTAGSDLSLMGLDLDSGCFLFLKINF